ncbi:MAG: hypothetical protein AAFV85_12260, partial [Cyanobacteria bacterium J06634_6]
ELSASIKIIESHYEFAPLIGIALNIKGATDETVIQFLAQWIKLHELQCDEDVVEIVVEDYQDFSNWLESNAERSKIRRNAWKAMSSSFTPEALAGLKALFYFSMKLDFSETYISMYENYLERENKVFSYQTKSLKDEFLHLLSKTTVMYNFLRSLYFLKQNHLAEEVVQRHGLDTKFSWLDKARSRELFDERHPYTYKIQ